MLSSAKDKAKAASAFTTMDSLRPIFEECYIISNPTYFVNCPTTPSGGGYLCSDTQLRTEYPTAPKIQDPWKYATNPASYPGNPNTAFFMRQGQNGRCYEASGGQYFYYVFVYDSSINGDAIYTNSNCSGFTEGNTCIFNGTRPGDGTRGRYIICTNIKTSDIPDYINPDWYGITGSDHCQKLGNGW